MTACHLRMAGDCLADSLPFNSIAAAKAHYFEAARELWRYGQGLEASIHFGKSVSKIQEYPNFVLSIGPKGGLKKEAT